MQRMDVLARLRDVPGAAAPLEALEGEPGVHVVGGAVRDVLLGREPRELDFVVEGDAAAVAARAAARLDGQVRVHPAFGTATVIAPGATFDLAAARTERYAHPGALPAVTLGVTVTADLARRDFTVNAMAVALEDGRLSEHPRAREDLAAGVLRVLHDRSFLDDPTRLLRLARYEARLGFAADPETDDLARAAIAGGLLAAVSGHRLGDELRLIAVEDIDALSSRGLGEGLLDGFEPHPLALRHALELLPADGRRDLLALASGCLGVRDLPPRLDELEFPARDRDVVVQAATRARALAEELDSARMLVPSRLARRLRTEAPETVALAGALGGSTATTAARHWLAELRHVRLDIGGDDLLAAGLIGPAVGAGLQAALDAKLDGRAPTPEQQLEVALASAR